MGTNDSHDGSGVERHQLLDPASHHPDDARWPSRATAVAADTPASDGERAVTAAGSRAAGERDRSAGVDEPGDDPGARADRSSEYAWLLVVPFAATLLGVAAGLVFGFGVYDTGTPGDVSLLPYVVLVPYFLAGLAGTLWLVEDATRLAAADADWQPNPWLYVLAGALVLEGVVAAPVVRGEVTTGVVPYLAGGFVLAALLSSVVVGPVYLLLRRRNLGAP